MRLLILFTVITVCFTSVLSPTSVEAQERPIYVEEEAYADVEDGTIVAGQGFVPCEGTTCSACHFGIVVNTVIKWLIGIISLIFAVLMVVTGFKLVTSGGNASAKEAAKSSFTNAIIGFLIVLAAWLVVDTLMRTLLGESGEIKGYGPWSEIECGGQYTSEIGKYEIIDGIEIDVFEGDTAPSPGSGAVSRNCPATPESQVVLVPSEMTSGGPEKVKPDTLSKFIAMREAALADGVNLKVVDGWRPESEQVALWNRYCGNGTCGQKKVGKPCSLGGNGSNHNSGVALDIAVGCGNGNSNCNTKTYRWLKANGARYGFSNRIQSDPPHWSPTGG